MNHKPKLPVRILVAAVLGAAAVYAVVRLPALVRRRTGAADGRAVSPGVAAPDRSSSPGDAAAPGRGLRRQPGAPTPSSEPALRIGPPVPEDAWIEAEVSRPLAAAWELLLAADRESGDALAVRRGTDGRFSLVETKGGVRRELASVDPQPTEETVTVCARGRGDEWSVWLDGRRAFGARSAVPAGSPVCRTGRRAGFRNEGAGPSLARLSVREVRDPAFADDFMREGPDETWKALSGAWELAGIHFPERSANPFALFARFPGGELHDPFVEDRWQKPKAGVGVHLSSWRGVVQVERITGNGPAAEAGIREHDIVLSIDGTEYLSVSPFTFFGDLEGPAGSIVNLTILRPGELRTRDYSLTRRYYRWARQAYGQPIGSGATDSRGLLESARRIAGQSREAEDSLRGRAAGAHLPNGRLAAGQAGPLGRPHSRSGEPHASVSEHGEAEDSLRGRAAGAHTDESLAVAGDPWWDGYRYEASVACSGAGGAGLAFAARDAGNYHCFAMVGDTGDAKGSDLGPNRLVLFRVRQGERAVLAEREWGPLWGTYYRLAVDLEGERMRTFLDGAQVFDVSEGDLPAGRIGAWALRGAGAYLDDAAVSTDRAATAPPEYARPSAVYADEIDMRVWANPADEWEPDPESDWWWNKYRFPGKVRMKVASNAKYRELYAQLGAAPGFMSSGMYFHVDRAPRVARVFNPWTTVRNPARVPPDGELGFALDPDGQACLSCGRRTVLTEEAAYRGDAVAMKGLENIDEPGVIQVTSSGVRDYYFRRAPVDWAVAAGKWGILNKWICDPRFSWFGGHSRSLAAVWNKNRFGGDVTLDFYAALVMIIDDPPYERVGDFNCTILADGKSLDSGYTLVVSGGRNRWVRLYGGGRLLAESRDPADRLPSNVARDQPRRFLHQRWFRITLERVKGRVRYSLDGREVFNVPDTIGIGSGYCGLWTQDNGMLVARARIAATSSATETTEDTRDGTTPSWGASVTRKDLDGLTNLVMGEVGTQIELDGRGPSGAPAVKVTNAQPGGAFAVASTSEVSGGKRVTFDFRAEEGARVDLYLMPPKIDVGELGPCRVRLTGPEGLNRRHPVLAGPLARADGEWHHVELHPDRLFESYATRHVLPRPPRTSGLHAVFCNLEEGRGTDYLPCGIGGNGPGTSYWISGLRIEDERTADREPPRVRRLLLPGEEGTPPDRLRVVFEDDCSGVDGKSILLALTPIAAAEEEAEAPGAGARRENGERLLRASSRAVSYDAATGVAEVDLASAGALPPFGRMTAGADLRPPRTGSLMVEVREYRDRSGKRGEPALRAWCPDEMPDGAGPELVYLELLPRVPGEVDLDFQENPRTYRELRRRLGGEAPAMSLDNDAAKFRRIVRTDAPAGEGTSLRITTSVLKSDCLFRIHDGPADLAQLLHLSFDYRMPPETPVNLVVLGRKSFHGVILSDEHDPVSEWSHRIRYAGRLEGFRADGEWHHAELDLARVFLGAYPHLTDLIIGGMYLCDWGWNGLWPGDGYWLDNLRVEGVRRGRDVSVKWRAYDVSGVERAAWALDASPETDPLADEGNTRPCQEITILPLREAAELPDGPAYFHLRLADGRGNWSRTFHKRLLVDNTPPRVERVRPADGASSAALEVAVSLEDYSGVDPLSVRLEVAGGQYRIDRRACVYDRAGGVLRWSARGAGVAEVFEPGTRIEAKLLSARDVVGNELVASEHDPHEWSWTYDPSLDRTPPPTRLAMRLTTGRKPTSYLDGPTFGDTNDFERELGPVERGRGCEVALSREAARHGLQGCRITVTPERRGYFALRLRERHWYTDRRPYLMLDYRLPPETERVALRIALLGEKEGEKREHEILMPDGRLAAGQAGPGARRRLDTEAAGAPRSGEPHVSAREHGEVEDSVRGRAAGAYYKPRGGVLVADGDWHRAVLDLGRRLEKTSEGRNTEWPVFEARPLRLAGPVYLVGRAPPGTELDIDNVEFVRRDWRGAVVDIPVPRRLEGESGVVGFSVLWDRRPDTVPPETVTHAVSPWLAGETFRLTSLPPFGRTTLGADPRPPFGPRRPVNVVDPTGRTTLGADRKDEGGDGLWYLHVRSVDGAGNWGEAGHLEADFGGR